MLIETQFIAVAEQADLLGLAAFFLILYGVKALFGNDKRRMPPALGGTGAIPLDEDGNPRAYDDLDDIEGWMADEIHRRRIESGGVLRCDRCKKLLMHADPVEERSKGRCREHRSRQGVRAYIYIYI